MLRRGLKSINELEKVKAREVIEKREKEAFITRPLILPSTNDASEFPLYEEPLPDFGDSF